MERLHGEGRTAVIVATVGVAVCLLAVGVVVLLTQLGKKPADPTPPTTDAPTPPTVVDKPPPPPPTEMERYDRLMKSAVWIESRTKIGAETWIGRGSGCLIQSGEEVIVLTAAHVVLGKDDIQVAFPRRKAEGGEWEYDPKAYRESKWQIKAEVLRLEKGVDLAVLKLKSVPKEAVPLKLAGGSPKVGSWCGTIGNQSPAGETLTAGLWAYKSGKVEHIDYKRYNLTGYGLVQAWMVQTDIVINQGDSGGPLVNDKDEVIGVNSNSRLEVDGGNIYKFQIEWRTVEAFVAGKKLPAPPP